jgi:hypothetical protein
VPELNTRGHRLIDIGKVRAIGKWLAVVRFNFELTPLDETWGAGVAALISSH